jgi:hypothetical protein
LFRNKDTKGTGFFLGVLQRLENVLDELG